MNEDAQQYGFEAAQAIRFAEEPKGIKTEDSPVSFFDFFGRVAVPEDFNDRLIETYAQFAGKEEDWNPSDVELGELYRNSRVFKNASAEGEYIFEMPIPEDEEGGGRVVRFLVPKEVFEPSN